MTEGKSAKKHLEEEDAKTPDVNSFVIGNLVDDLV
jgi:hypothetical protein